MLAALPPWIADVAVVGGAIVAFFAAGKTLINALDGVVEHYTAPIMKELTFNGGETVKDMTLSNRKAISELDVKVTEGLARVETRAAEVKADLEASHARADATPSYAPSGEAADAASKSPVD